MSGALIFSGGTSGSSSSGAGAVIGFTTTDNLGAGLFYESDLIAFSSGDYSQVQTEALSDSDGTLLFTFYSDVAGTDVIRTLSVPYLASSGYRQFGAPTFGASVKYRFTDSGQGNTDFYFSTKLVRGAISGQGLALDAFVSPTMMATLNRSVLSAANPSGNYGNVGIDEAGHLSVAISRPVTAFGEMRATHVSPVVQIDAVYGLQDNVETFIDVSPGTGTVGTTNGNFQCTTGVGVGGYGVIRSRRAVRYRPGQGLFGRWTAGFDTPTALSLQGAGLFNSTNGFFVGHDGANDFGVMHRTGGRHEIRTLTVSAAATGAETATVTLNSVAYAIPVTSGSIVHNTNEISAWLNANQTVWEAYQNDGTVVLFGLGVGPLAGTYSLANGGGGETIAGTIAQDGAGVANTETWTNQGSFSEDQLDGTGSSGMTIDPTKGNVYECDVQYLGYGNVEMQIENPLTGRFFIFHKFQFANARTEPTLLNPSFKVGWIAASLGSTTDLTVFGGSALGAIDGKLHPFRRPRSHSYQRGSVGATLTSVFAIRIRSAYRGVVQLSEVLPKIAFVSPDGSKACEVSFLLNPVFSGEQDWTYIDETDSIAEYDQTGTTFSDTGDVIASFVVAGGISSSLNFKDLAESSLNPVHLERGDTICIAAKIVGGAGNNVTASLTWLEES
jgi:hypothetical protein